MVRRWYVPVAEVLQREGVQHLWIMDSIEVFVGVFRAEQVVGGVGVGADDYRYAQRFHLLNEPFAGVVVGVTSLVDTAGVDFANEIQFVDEVDGLEGEG